MIASSRINSSLMDGVLIATPTNTAVLFASNHDGSALHGGASYVLAPASGTVKNLIFDLVPGAGYTITIAAGAQPIVTLAPAGTNTAHANGVLVFTTDNQGQVKPESGP